MRARPGWSTTCPVPVRSGARAWGPSSSGGLSGAVQGVPHHNRRFYRYSGLLPRQAVFGPARRPSLAPCRRLRSGLEILPGDILDHTSSRWRPLIRSYNSGQLGCLLGVLTRPRRRPMESPILGVPRGAPLAAAPQSASHPPDPRRGGVSVTCPPWAPRPGGLPARPALHALRLPPPYTHTVPVGSRPAPGPVHPWLLALPAVAWHVRAGGRTSTGGTWRRGGGAHTVCSPGAGWVVRGGGDARATQPSAVAAADVGVCVCRWCGWGWGPGRALHLCASALTAPGGAGGAGVRLTIRRRRRPPTCSSAVAASTAAGGCGRELVTWASRPSPRRAAPPTCAFSFSACAAAGGGGGERGTCACRRSRSRAAPAAPAPARRSRGRRRPPRCASAFAAGAAAGGGGGGVLVRCGHVRPLQEAIQVPEKECLDGRRRHAVLCGPRRFSAGLLHTPRHA